jgi:hypothetical protein
MLAETLIRISFSVIGQCSLVPTCHWLQGKCARVNLSPAAFCFILQNHRRLLVSIYSVKTLSLIISFKEETKIFKNYQRMYRKYIFIIISLQTNFSSRDTIPLKVQKREFCAFYSYLCINIKVLSKKNFDWAIIKRDTIVPLILRLSRIDFSLY